MHADEAGRPDSKTGGILERGLKIDRIRNDQKKERKFGGTIK